jgi:hypothetical protein
MPLAACRECGGQVSVQAPFCPHCGAPYPSRRDWGGFGIDWRTKASLGGYPLVHVAYGRDASGRRRVARGVIAVGQFAVGAVVIAQFGIAYVFGLGQFVFGPIVVAQFALALALGVGQFATGVIAIGQIAVGWYVLAIWGVGPHLCTAAVQDPEAVAVFRRLGDAVKW